MPSRDENQSDPWQQDLEDQESKLAGRRKLSIVVAVSANGVIGRDQKLPWRLSSDLKRFKQLTMGHALLMGRKTFESIGRPLPGRTTIILTRQQNVRASGVIVAHTVDQALSAVDSEQQIFVVGGAEVYRLVLPRCDKIYVTRVLTQVEGDSYFSLPETGWKCTKSTSFPAGPRDDFPTLFEEWERSRVE